MRGSRGFGLYLGSFSLTHGMEKCAKLYVGSRFKGLPDIGRFDTLRTLADVERLGTLKTAKGCAEDAPRRVTKLIQIPTKP